nr:methylsterol monooxygenase 2-2 [Ipomoea batatas]
MEGKKFCFCIPRGKKNTKAKDDSETPMSSSGAKNEQTGHGNHVVSNHDGVASHDAGGMAAAMMASSHVSQMEGLGAAEGSSHGGAGHGGGEGGGVVTEKSKEVISGCLESYKKKRLLSPRPTVEAVLAHLWGFIALNMVLKVAFKCIIMLSMASAKLTMTKNNTPAAQEKCITRLLLYHFGVNLPVMILSYPVFRHMGMRSSLPLPSWKVISTQILFYFILEDFVFYWGHRILHTKWLYKHVHSVHHEYATPFGLTSEYAHPAEILFLGFATIFGPAITGPHLITLWLWMVLRVLETVEAHCGYHFPWSLSNFLPLYGGADFHDYHHRLLYTKSGNYSSTFVYMDWIFGTDKGYRKLKALKSDGSEVDLKEM